MKRYPKMVDDSYIASYLMKWRKGSEMLKEDMFIAQSSRQLSHND
jgi:hypothetical protein